MLVKLLACSPQILQNDDFPLAFSMEYFEISIILISPVHYKLLLA